MTSNDHSVWAYEPPAGREPVRQLVRIYGPDKTVVYRFDPPAGTVQKERPVVIIHGIQSHPGWYAKSSLALADAGYTVYAVTRRGCGENKRSRRAAFGTQQMDSDLDKICDHVQSETGSQTMHFVGISWGGKYLSVALKNKRRARRACTFTLLCPGIAAKIKPPLVQRVFRAFFVRGIWYLFALWMAAICTVAGVFWYAPKSVLLHTVRVLPADVLLSWQTCVVAYSLLACRAVIMFKRFPIPLDDPALFTDTPARRAYLAANPETLHSVTGNFGFSDADLDRKVRGKKTLSMPTTLVLSGRDRIIDNDKTRRIVKRMREDVYIVTLPGSHTLEFEEEITPLVDAMRASFKRGES